MELRLLETAEVRIHEEVMPTLLRQVVDSITHLRLLKDPVLVDRRSRTVLDGTHRVGALLHLGIPLMPCCLLDYSDAGVRVHRWYRTFPDAGPLPDILSQVCVVSVSRSEARRLLSEGEAKVALATKNEVHMVPGTKDPVDSSWSASDLEFRFRRMGVSASYETERDAFHKLDADEAALVLMYQPMTKEDVVLSAHSERLFAHKSTRHVVPARPLGVNIPLDVLTPRGEEEETTRRFRSIVLRRKVVDLGPGGIIEGRRYEENVYWFGDEA